MMNEKALCERRRIRMCVSSSSSFSESRLSERKHGFVRVSIGSDCRCLTSGCRAVKRFTTSVGNFGRERRTTRDASNAHHRSIGRDRALFWGENRRVLCFAFKSSDANSNSVFEPKEK
jgi:hypothetical protein